MCNVAFQVPHREFRYRTGDNVAPFGGQGLQRCTWKVPYRATITWSSMKITDFRLLVIPKSLGFTRHRQKSPFSLSSPKKWPNHYSSDGTNARPSIEQGLGAGFGVKK